MIPQAPGIGFWNRQSGAWKLRMPRPAAAPKRGTFRVRRDLGDFQTPPELVAKVLETMARSANAGRAFWSPPVDVVISSPACLPHQAPREIQAIEIQESHFQAARSILPDGGTIGVGFNSTRADLFEIDVGRELTWCGSGPLLVIGNPPWVTNSELGTLATPQPPRGAI